MAINQRPSLSLVDRLPCTLLSWAGAAFVPVLLSVCVAGRGVYGGMCVCVCACACVCGGGG